MYCAHCGSELPSDGTVCARCGFSTQAPAPARSSGGSPDPVEELLRETKRAVNDLAAATVKLSQRFGTHAEAAAKDPSGTAKRALDRLKKDIDSLVNDVTNALNKL